LVFVQHSRAIIIATNKPVVGIIANFLLIDDLYPAQTSGHMNMDAIAEVTDAIPVIIPARPQITDIGVIMEVCDGFLFTGGRPNVHPEEYGQKPTEAHGTFDKDRDQVTLPLIRACVDAGQPILGLCRGFQEFNVAFGGSLHPEIRDLPGRMNHRMPPDGTLEERFELRHSVQLSPGSFFSQIFGSEEIVVNSLHGQGIDQPGERVSVDGFAPDGTSEALTIKDAPGFAAAVQWHAEYKAAEDTVSSALFRAFGKALVEWKNTTSPGEK